MDKEKQIKKLTKELDYCETHECVGGSCSECRAIWLVEQGYRKIPEGSVVLSREEYNALLLEQKRLREIVDRIPCGYELKEQARKETAEKIFNDIFALVNNTKDKSSKIFGNSSEYGKGYKNSVNHFNEHILELAKQFGVEIGEEV